jgi:hypothetical protein
VKLEILMATLNTFGTSLQLAGEHKNEFRRHTGKPGGGWLFARFKKGNAESIIAAAKYVGATDVEIKTLLSDPEKVAS